MDCNFLSEGFKLFNDTLKDLDHAPKAILLTDGCDSNETREIIRNNKIGEAVYLLCKFKTDSSTCAAHAFEVIDSNYRDILNDNHSKYYERLIQPISFIKRKFENKFEINYQFKENENVRELFDLERISYH